MKNTEFKTISQEIKSMKHMNHANIINCISSWYNKMKKEVVIITEILCGGSIKKHLIKIHNPRLKVIKIWIKQILQGLKYLHNEVDPPLIHRDIKSENIFLDGTNGTVKLGDLRLSVHPKKMNSKIKIGSEADYEGEISNGKLSTLSDIYSLGIFIIEIAVSGDGNMHRDLFEDFHNGNNQEVFLLNKYNVSAYQTEY
jgi:WNK lysine deficient protein kinase